MATTPTTNKTSLQTVLPIIAKDVSSIKLSVMKMVKNYEKEQKEQKFERTRQKAEAYKEKYKKTRPSQVVKDTSPEQKKSLLDIIKDGIADIFKFILLGLAAIGLSKILSAPGVKDGIIKGIKKLVIGISELIQKGLSMMTNLLNDPEILTSLKKLVKDIFMFIGDGILKASEFVSKLVNDPDIQNTIKNVLSSVLSTIIDVIKNGIVLARDFIVSNKELVKETFIKTFVGISDAIVGGLKFAGDLIKDEQVRKSLVAIVTSIGLFVDKVLSEPVFEVAGKKINLKQVLLGLGAAVIAFGLAMSALTGYILTKVVGGALGGKSGGKNVPRKRGKAGMALGVTDVVVGSAAGYYIGKEFYDAFGLNTDEVKKQEDYIEQRLNSNTTSPTTSNTVSPTPTPAPTTPTTSPVPAGRMPKSLEEYVDMEFERKKAREGFRTKAYASPEGGEDTVGIGHKLTPKEQELGGVFIGGKLVKVDRNTPLTNEQVRQLYQQDIANHAAAAKNKLNKLAGEDVWNKLNPMQQYALMDLSFAGGSRMITQDLANAIKMNDMAKASQIIQQKGRTYTKNGVVIESKHHAKHADLRADIFRGNDPLLTAGNTTVASYTPNEQRQSKPYPTPTQTATMPTMASSAGKEPTGHSYAPGSDGEPSKTPEKPTGIMSSLLESLSGGIANINEASGGKLGFFSNELQAILRDKSFLEAIDTPMFADMSKNINSSDTTAYEGKTPSVYDEMLLSKLTRA